jgi:hypothetical protein
MWTPMRAIRILGGTAVLALSFAVAGSGGTARSGAFGVVTRGPVMPVCIHDLFCDELARGVTLVFARAGSTRRATTDGEGRYRVALRPGRYTVRLTTSGLGSVVMPTTVQVPRGRFVRVEFHIDTGIR